MKKQMMVALALAGLTAGLVTGKDANRIVVDGSTTVGPIAKAFAEHYQARHADVSITVSESGSGNGAKSLINDACDVATMSRPMKPSEKDAAKAAGILPIEHLVALDGIAMIVNPANPATDLSIEQIRKIYTGEIRNWKDLGGPDQAIVIISRDTNSGTYETFETMVLNKQKLTPKAEYVGSNGAIRQRVMSTPAAIGYVGLAFTEGVKVVTVNKIAASVETVVGKTYPIARPLFMYTNGHPKEGSALFDFVNMANTEEGRRIVADVGFVALPPK